MPIYVYEVVVADGEAGQVFEVMQKMSDAPLTKHPTTGQPVRRAIQLPHIAGQWSEAGARKQLSDKNIEAHGLTNLCQDRRRLLREAGGQRTERHRRGGRMTMTRRSIAISP